MYHIRVAFTQETHPDFISKAIMFFLKAKYSHVLILFEDIDGQEKILHSVGEGTCIVAKADYLTTHKIVKQYKIPMKVTKEEFSFYAKGRCGREYSDSQYVNMILEKIGIKWVPFKNGNEKAVCSEEVAAAGPMTQLYIPQNVNLDLVDPTEVDMFLASQPKAELEIGA